MNDCLFCKILKKELPSEKVYENEKVYAFKDIYPMAKEHVLFIHKNHSKNFSEMNDEDMLDVFRAIKEYTKSESLIEKGYRVVTNINEYGGQTVFHTHFHVLSGEKLKGFGA